MSCDNLTDVQYGESMGYVVVCWNGNPGEFAVDWDGDVHSDFETAREELQNATSAGEICWLATLIKTESS